MRAFFLRLIFKRDAKLVQGIAAHPHPPSLRSGTFSRAKSAGEGGRASMLSDRGKWTTWKARSKDRAPTGSYRGPAGWAGAPPQAELAGMPSPFITTVSGPSRT
jgi:hypothetical protein